MRNSAWSLLALTASIVTLASFALALPTLHGGSGERESAWDLLREWHRQGQLQEGVRGDLQAQTDDRTDFQTTLQIKLQLQDQFGEPVIGARIACDRVTETSIGRVADSLSNEGGQFLSQRLQPGLYEIQIEADDFLPVEIVTLELPKDGIMTLIPMQLGARVGGRLDGADGAPRNHGVLALRPTADRKVDVLWCKPDVQGNFLFPPIAEGEWTLAWLPNRRQTAGPNLTTAITCVAGQSQSFQVTLASPDRRAASDALQHPVGIRPIVQD
ncbi:MAG: carboxypeptidase-like regulatory domain-containing protein [Planctomycetota bacterium]